MAKVKNLAIKLQSGSDSTYYASWDFEETTKTTTTTSNGIKKGDLVSIKSGAKYYNGVAIPSWVMADQWYISYIKGDRAVLGKNKSGTNNIESPINVKYLTGGSSSSTTVSENTLDHYYVQWFYDTGDGIWFKASTEDTEFKNSIYSSPPENATKIQIHVKPVSKTKTVNGKETTYWTGETTYAIHELSKYSPPANISTPNVTLDKYKLTASLENIADARTDQVEFQVYNGTKLISSGTVAVELCMASYTCNVTAGGEYRVRCRAINMNGSSKVYGEWSALSSAATAIPSAPTGITTIRGTSDTSVYLEWPIVDTAKTYEIEYTTEKRYFDGSSETTKVNAIEFNHYEVTGLQSGDEYFFRVRAVNTEGESAWSDISSITIGKKPSAPTTWSSTTTAIVGDKLTLYWVHNAIDGSSQTYGELELYINGVKETHTIQNTTNEDEKDKTSFYEINTASYKEGTQIQWRVRTAGITKEYGEWSVQRTIDVYAPPTLELDVTDVNGQGITTLTSFPFYVKAVPGPNTQAPIGYHLSIVANNTYTASDYIGNPVTITEGDEVYAKYFDINEVLTIELLPGNVDLQNGISYTVKCTVSMNSGLTSEASVIFTVSWTDEEYEPDAEISVDTDTYVAYIRPNCRDAEGNLIENVLLSVYRREFDGEFTELSRDIDNTKNTVVTDPHPSLDYARYRIVAMSSKTGAISFYDVPAYPVACDAVIVQWDEEWSYFDTTISDVMQEQPWTGSMLKLLYNVDISEKHKKDVSLVEYIGRKRPVAYYGTQLGETSVWNMVIPATDIETLYALRRLAIWAGNVYIRHPSGVGYWASIDVDFSQKHTEVTIPITIDVTRVEGGI